MSQIGPPGISSKAQILATGKKTVTFEVDEQFAQYAAKNNPSGVLSFLPDGDQPALGRVAEKPKTD